MTKIKLISILIPTINGYTAIFPDLADGTVVCRIVEAECRKTLEAKARRKNPRAAKKGMRRLMRKFESAILSADVAALTSGAIAPRLMKI